MQSISRYAVQIFIYRLNISRYLWPQQTVAAERKTEFSSAHNDFEITFKYKSGDDNAETDNKPFFLAFKRTYCIRFGVPGNKKMYVSLWCVQHHHSQLNYCLSVSLEYASKGAHDGKRRHCSEKFKRLYYWHTFWCSNCSRCYFKNRDQQWESSCSAGSSATLTFFPPVFVEFYFWVVACMLRLHWVGEQMRKP